MFIDLLNKVRAGKINDDFEKLLKARLIHESHENYPKHVFHMYVENEAALKRNKAVLKDLPGELYRIEADGKVPDNCKYPLTIIQAAQNQRQRNTRSLVKLLKLKIAAKLILTVNLDKLI